MRILLLWVSVDARNFVFRTQFPELITPSNLVFGKSVHHTIENIVGADVHQTRK
jgi:hypothetical protein